MWKFLKSSSDKSNFYIHRESEICFWGRSNVGKSTLINTLTNQALAKVSKTPGRTQLINYFIDNNNKIIVDLPGYGFAKMSKEAQTKMFNNTISYINNSKSLLMLFLLIDSRTGITKIDNEMIQILEKMQINISLVFTKIDKLNQSEKSKLVKEINNNLKTKMFNNVFVLSSAKKQGIDELVSYINELLYNI